MAISTKQKERNLTRNNEELSLKIQEEPIDNVLITKYLGIQVDRNLDWKGRIKALSSKISRAIGLLKHAKRFVPQDTLKTLYTGIVEPHFRFCCSVWGNCGTMEKEPIAKASKSSGKDTDKQPP